jgi:RNA polymerase sigma-70 factor (ECF subfamily)
VVLADGRERRPDHMTSAHQRAWAVRSALTKLSSEQRQVLELAYFNGLSHREIAEQTQLPLGTVKSRILAGMRVLRTELDFLRGETP